MHLTKFRIKFPYTAPTRIVRKAWMESDLKASWKDSSWSQKAQSIRKVHYRLQFTQISLTHSNFSNDETLL